MSFPKFLNDTGQALAERLAAGISLGVEFPAKDVMHEFASLPIQFAGMPDAGEEGHV